MISHTYNHTHLISVLWLNLTNKDKLQLTQERISLMKQC